MLPARSHRPGGSQRYEPISAAAGFFLPATYGLLIYRGCRHRDTFNLGQRSFTLNCREALKTAVTRIKMLSPSAAWQMRGTADVAFPCGPKAAGVDVTEELKPC